MKKAIILLLLLGLSTGVFSGCKSREVKNSALKDELSLALSDEVLVVAGFNPLVDKRPKEDIAYMTSVKEKVSEKILNTLKSMRLFNDIHSPALENDYMVISGEIRRFNWESFDTMISYIPGLNVLPFFGLPANGDGQAASRLRVPVWRSVGGNFLTRKRQQGPPHCCASEFSHSSAVSMSSNMRTCQPLLTKVSSAKRRSVAVLLRS